MVREMKRWHQWGLAVVGLGVGSLVLTLNWSPRLTEVTVQQASAESLQLVPKSVEWFADKGVHLAFNEPVQSISWQYDGTKYHANFPNPETSMWLPVPLKQGSAASLNVQTVVTSTGTTLDMNKELQATLPTPLTVTTSPGPWQMNVTRSGPWTLRFSAPVRDREAIDHEVQFQPAVSGTWQWIGRTIAEFFPSQRVRPTVLERMTLFGGPEGPQGVAGQFLTQKSIVRPFYTASNQKIVVREGDPETLTLYRDGKPILVSKCNTGVDHATPLGHFYVRNKFLWVNMIGTNPNGTHYNVPHVPWVMPIDGNIAIHGYPRAAYGFPQSAGCVELPIPVAKKLWHMIHVGTPVTIKV